MRAISEVRRQLLESTNEAIANGSVTAAQIAMWLIYLREHCDGEQIMLRDLADCLAHSEKDRGPAVAFLRSFARELREHSLQARGEILFPIEQVIGEAVEVLSALGVRHDPGKMHGAFYLIGARVAEVLDGVTVPISAMAGDTCFFVYDIQADSRFIQPAYFFNHIIVDEVPVGQLTLPGMLERSHAHLSGPLFFHFATW